MTKQQLIRIRTANLRKSSPWYDEDYAAVVRVVNKMTSKQLEESASREKAIAKMSDREIHIHCQC
jgi:hypothetical protein